MVYNIFPDSFASSRRAIIGSGTEKCAGSALSRSRLGGTINGIRENLDYISEFGANCLSLNPIFVAGQYHKYDTIDYLHIDPCFGTDEDFRLLVDECHARGMSVILDGVFNHCGAQFFAFRDVLEKQERSRYTSWFYRLQFPVVYPEAGERPNYECFCYERLMPKLDTSNPEVCDYLCAVGEHWLREFDTDGWRLDVADEPNDDFWREFRRRCKAVKGNALLIGEVWGGARHWLSGDMLDSTMNYDFRRYCRRFFAEGSVDAATFDSNLTTLLFRYQEPALLAQLNLLDSHDVSRFFSLCGEDLRKMELAVVFLMTFPGVPMLYYGDELGLSGQQEEEYRCPMPWGQTHPLQGIYQALIDLRHRKPALRRGNFRTFLAEGRTLGYSRTLEGSRICVVVDHHRQGGIILFEVADDRDMAQRGPL